MKVLKKQLVINSKYYQQILSCLQSNNATSRLIGGCVRDALLNKPNKDIDIATTLLPKQVIKTLLAHKIKVIPTGIKFGTVTALLDDEKFEITTLRKDLNCNGRHPKVSFTTDFALDAARRDFTINALSYCPFEHKIYDYYSGIQDLKQAKVVFVGDPTVRIKEDFLRILRFLRFSCYYANQLDKEGLKACTELKDNLKSLSKERIKWEMDKLIESDNSLYILQLMFDSRILPIIFPIEYFDSKTLKVAINFAKEANIKLKAFARYGLLLNNTSKLKITDLLDLKFSKQEAVKICSIINFLRQFPLENSVNLSLRKIWLEEDDYLDYISVSLASKKLTPKQAKEFIIKYGTLKRPKFPVTGHDILQLGIIGKKLGNSLKQLKNNWIESDFILSKEQLLKLLNNQNENLS